MLPPGGGGPHGRSRSGFSTRLESSPSRPLNPAADPYRTRSSSTRMRRFRKGVGDRCFGRAGEPGCRARSGLADPLVSGGTMRSRPRCLMRGEPAEGGGTHLWRRQQTPSSSGHTPAPLARPAVGRPGGRTSILRLPSRARPPEPDQWRDTAIGQPAACAPARPP